MTIHSAISITASKARKVAPKMRALVSAIRDPYYFRKVAGSVHTWIYSAILIALVLSYYAALSAVTYFVLLIMCLSLFSGCLYLLDRVSNLKQILSVEQTKLMLKDAEIRETLFHKKELQYKIDKLTNSTLRDLPIYSQGKIVSRSSSCTPKTKNKVQLTRKVTQ